jgi:hypothetical protein
MLQPSFIIHCQPCYERFVLKREGEDGAKEFPTLVHALEHAKKKGGQAFTVLNPDGKVIIQSDRRK